MEPFDVLATVRADPAVHSAADGGSHRLRADCAGDPIARLALYVDDRLVLDAFDDDPLAPGAIGMWVESRDAPTAVTFDGLLVSEAESD
jgi:hypothetical protein